MTEKKTYSHGYWAENSELKLSVRPRTNYTTDSGVFLSYFLFVIGVGILSCHWLKPRYYSLGRHLCIDIVSFLMSLSEEYLSFNLGLLWGTKIDIIFRSLSSTSLYGIFLSKQMFTWHYALNIGVTQVFCFSNIQLAKIVA